MVKVLEIGGQHDAEEEDDCCEIGLAEFAKKVNLKAADDDVVVVAAKGPIKVKVEALQSGKCQETNGNLHDRAAGDCMENPYEIDEDESTIHRTESAEDVKCDIKSPVKPEGFDEVSPVKCEPEDGNGADEHFEEVTPESSLLKFGSVCFEDVIPDMPPVKCEPEDSGGADASFLEVTPDVSLPKCKSDCFEEVIAGMSPVKFEPEEGNGGYQLFGQVVPDMSESFEEVASDMLLVENEHFEEVIPDMSLRNCKPACFEEVIDDMSQVKFEPEEGNGGCELFGQVVPDMSPMKCESESFEEVVADMSLVESEQDDSSGADEHFEEVIPDMFLLKGESECFEETTPDVSPVKHECLEEDAYDHLPEMDIGGSVFDEEDKDDFVVVRREVL